MRLSNQRYEEIKIEIANLLEDYNVRELPIDVFALAKKTNVKIIFASELLGKYPKKLNEYMIFTYPDSYLVYNQTLQQFVIYLDDIGTKKKRQRFSLAHELMHIVLGHFEQNAQNEAEANFGATYLLAPTSLALIEQKEYYLLDPEMISKIFDVSMSESQIVARYNSKRLSIGIFEELPYEKVINDLLRDSLLININRSL